MEKPINVPNPGVLFRYRLLARMGYLDDDLLGEDVLRPNRPAGRIAVDHEACIGCFACRSICPTSAIRIWEDLAHITDPIACLSCPGAPCIGSCPTGALSDRPPWRF